MKKKLLSLALVLAMALTLLPTAAFAANHDPSGTCASATYAETAAKPATCTEAGYAAYYTCSGCSGAFEDNAGVTAIADLDAWKAENGGGYEAPKGHTLTHHDAADSTCKDKGNIEYWSCSVCSKNFSDSAGNTEAADVTKPLAAHTLGSEVAEVPATCSAPGTKAHYPCSVCSKNFSDSAGQTELSDLTIAKLAHTDDDGDNVCDVCGKSTSCTGKADCTADTHTTNKCISQCTGAATCPNNEGFHKANCASLCTEDENCPNTAGTASYHKANCPKKSAPAVTITSVSAQYDGTTLSVTWKLSATLAQATAFQVMVDSNDIPNSQDFTFTTEAMGDSNVSCSFTKQVAIPDGTHKVIVTSTAVTGDGRDTITVTSAPSTPSVPSDGIPNPGSVTTPAAAESAIKNIQSAGADKIAAEIEKELADTSSDASTATIDKLEKLETAVMDQANIKVSVSPDSKVPEALNTKKVSIIGAALNAEKTSNTKVELKISAPKTERTLGRNYDNDVAVQFSMTLTNVVNAKKLAVPVIITVPLPAGISSSKAVVLHYAGTDSASQVLQSKVSGGYISFAATGFSDFIITQRVERKTSSGGGGGGGTKVTNIPVTVTPTVPSAPAGIFTDVPAGHSFASQITWARDNGVMGGYADGSFRPANPTNRQQLWMVLARLSGAAPADMAAAREWAVNSGVSDGANGEGALSRQQLVTMLYRYAQSQEMNLEGAADLAAYPDNAAVASYAQEALAWAVGKGIVTGTSDGRLNPEGTATRGQFAVIMYRFSHQG